MSTLNETAVLRKASLRIIPFLFLLYIVSFMDRTNVSFAALTMNHDIGLTPKMFGLGAGIFFIGMCPFEVPSNLMMVRFGARRWLARIMLVWGCVTLATSLIVGPHSFYTMRFLLGISEAGFFPGVLFYLTFWFPREIRTRIVANFMISLPLAAAVGAPISTFVLEIFNGVLGLPGWRWLFIVEGLPAVVLALVTFLILQDRPAEAKWLLPAERSWLQGVIDREHREDAAKGQTTAVVWSTLSDWRTLVITFTGVCFVIGFYGAGFWLPQIIKTFKVSTMQVGFLVALPNVLGAAAMLLWARRSRRGARISHVVIPQVLSCIAFLAAAYFLHQPVIAMIAICIAMIGLYASMPAYWSLPTTFFSGSAAAVALAFVNAVSNLGGFFGPTIMGWLRQTTGSFQIATGMLGLFILVGAVALLALAPALRHLPVAPRAALEVKPTAA
jgi:ACS family tartrate transporter-like MFS transporter